CYTSQNLYHNRIITNLMDKIDHMENFRDIRRVSLEDSFFEQFNMQIGNSIKCPNCGEMVDVNHPAYVKQKICYHCYEKIE
ncbi:MAG: ATP-binding protein, partial [Lachnospiraceae bacterium]|nr:ATP-binding protein [Lachnospiraceae bacterium]